MYLSLNLAASRHQQTGAVLLLSLIILTVMAILSATGMESAIINERMASNHQVREVSFQVAESGGGLAMAEPVWINEALSQLARNEADRNWPNYNVNFPDNHSTLSVQMEARQSFVPGNSIRHGGTFSYYTVETVSNAQSFGDISTTIVKGFTRAGAG
jgi:hypothetical protein